MKEIEITNITNTDDILNDVRGIINIARESAYQAVNIALVK